MCGNVKAHGSDVSLAKEDHDPGKRVFQWEAWGNEGTAIKQSIPWLNKIVETHHCRHVDCSQQTTHYMFGWQKIAVRLVLLRWHIPNKSLHSMLGGSDALQKY